MPTAKKEATIEELRERLASAPNLFFTNHAGLTVGQITKLRSELRKDGSTFAVVKNTLFSRAADETLAKSLTEILAGPTAIVFAGADPVAPAKALKTFSDTVHAVEVKGAYVDGKLIDASAVKVLASMPSKVELQAKLLGLLVAPARNILGVLHANHGGFARLLSARATQLAESAAA